MNLERLSGKLFDRDIGLYYFNARWYDAETGKFVTQDPIRDGVNWWNYCNGNPLIFVDPTGNYWEYVEEGNTLLKIWVEETVATGVAGAKISSVAKFGVWGVF